MPISRTAIHVGSGTMFLERIILYICICNVVGWQLALGHNLFFPTAWCLNLERGRFPVWLCTRSLPPIEFRRFLFPSPYVLSIYLYLNLEI